MGGVGRFLKEHLCLLASPVLIIVAIHCLVLQLIQFTENKLKRIIMQHGARILKGVGGCVMQVKEGGENRQQPVTSIKGWVSSVLPS